MSRDVRSSQDSRIGIFQIVILVLSLVVLVALAVDTLWSLPPEVSSIIEIMDTTVCFVFLGDFIWRLHKAPSKWAFMKWGWIDLLASIPSINLLRWGRMIRVLRIIRLLRGVRSVQKVVMIVFKDKIQGGAVSMVLTMFLLVIFSSISVLVCERGPESNIKTAEDAVWWSIATITTAGGSDKYPITTEGHILSMGLMISGMALFGGLSGLVASFFMGGGDQKNADNKEILARLDQIQKQLAQSSQQNPGSDRLK
jgi:voltage-gated potassium channel